ncbi:zinc ribbon domain-containing protein [Halorubellus sp. PRR65]|uniref:FmdB family zinc ribbon protein n=1 Tax=Halorubellus sp. PRR65 TaxID=3098148 RepID=UPI002B257517|nr:zinc ribbon domain-containing protein [Halorubellus sp. PRR65]
MSLVDRLKGLFGSEERTYEYWCPNCEATFESTKADMSSVHCPECGETRVRASAMADPVA